jgi:hypothetical protein
MSRHHDHFRKSKKGWCVVIASLGNDPPLFSVGDGATSSLKTQGGDGSPLVSNRISKCRSLSPMPNNGLRFEWAHCSNCRCIQENLDFIELPSNIHEKSFG